MLSKIIVSIEPTKANIYPALRVKPEEAWLQADWNMELTQVTSHLLYPQAKDVSSFPLILDITSAYYFCYAYIYQPVLLSSFSLLTQIHSHAKWIHTPVLLESLLPPADLYERGPAGVVKAFRYQIGHKDYTHTRLKHNFRLLGIITIISLILQGCGTDGGMLDRWGIGGS